MTANRAPPRDDAYLRQKRMKRLLKRVAWLTNRIENSETGANLGFDESERAALLWAIEIVRERYPELAETQPPKR